MNPGEVIMHEVDCHRMGLILNLVIEAFGGSGHSWHAHPHGQVLPFHALWFP